MLVSLRLQVRVLYEKQKNLTNKLETSEHKAQQRKEELLVRDQEIVNLQRQITNLKRQIDLEKVRLNFTLKETRQAAEKEKIEMKNAMEKATAEFENNKRALKKALLENTQEIAQVRRRLEESVRETSDVTDNFMKFYDDYLRLERDLTVIEQEVAPLRTQMDELAKAMNLEPEELGRRLKELKNALTGNESVDSFKDLLIKTFLDVEKDEVTPKDAQVASTSGGSSASASLNDPLPCSSSNIEQNDLSCPFSQKVLSEQLDNPAHKEKEKKHEAQRGRMVRLKLGFKIPNWPLRQRQSRYVIRKAHTYLIPEHCSHIHLVSQQFGPSFRYNH